MIRAVIIGLLILNIVCFGILKYEEKSIDNTINWLENRQRELILGSKIMRTIDCEIDGNVGFMHLMKKLHSGQRISDSLESLICSSYLPEVEQWNDLHLWEREIRTLETIYDVFCYRGCFEGIGGDGLAIQLIDNDELIRIKHFKKVIMRGLFMLNNELKYVNLREEGIELSDVNIEGDSIILEDAIGNFFKYSIEQGNWEYYH